MSTQIGELAQLVREAGIPAETRTIASLEAELPDVLILCVSAEISLADTQSLEHAVARFRDPARDSSHLILVSFGGDEHPHFGALDYLDLSSRPWGDAAAPLIQALAPVTRAISRQSDSSLALGIETVRPGFIRTHGSVLVASDGMVSKVEDSDRDRTQAGRNAISSMVSIGAQHIAVGYRNGEVRLTDRAVLSGSRLVGEMSDEILGLAEFSETCVVAHTARQIAIFDSLGETLWTYNNDVTGFRCVDAAAGYVAVGTRSGEIYVFRPDIESKPDVRQIEPDIGVLSGHRLAVDTVLFSNSGDRLFSGSEDRTVGVWDLSSHKCLRVLEGFLQGVSCLSVGEQYLAAGGRGGTIKAWDLKTLSSAATLKHRRPLSCLEAMPDGTNLLINALDFSGEMHTWRLTDSPDAENEEYINAKVMLVGDSQAGKTGIATRLVTGRWELTESTVGAWASQWVLPESGSQAAVTREVWLWDFGGQSDQQIVHQLFMTDTALAVLVFDGHRPESVSRIREWSKVLKGAIGDEAPKILVSGRTDVNRVLARGDEIDELMGEYGYEQYLETSAKTGLGCDELATAIRENIDWDGIPWRSTPTIFRTIKDAVLSLRDGNAVSTVRDIRDAIALSVPAFTLLELQAVLGLLSGPGAVQLLPFGGHVVLKPEVLNNYAQLIIADIRRRPDDLGSVLEERILRAEFDIPEHFERLDAYQERVVLHALLELFLRNGLCMRERTAAQGRENLLVFPSLQARGRPSRDDESTYFTRYYFEGDIEEVYARLIVNLRYSDTWTLAESWQNAIDFRSPTGRKVTISLAEDDGGRFVGVTTIDHLDVDQLVVLLRFIHNQILARSLGVRRVRTFSCDQCDSPIQDSAAVEHRQLAGQKDAVCVRCEARIPIWDEIEDRYASDELRDTAFRMLRDSQRALDNESRERVLVGDVMSRVALAQHISREQQVSDWGIDMEVEFKDVNGVATGRKVYLQLKSGDSHVKQYGGGRSVFRIKKSRHRDYWSDQAFPVYLIWRSGSGAMRWANLTKALGESESLNLPIKLKEFDVGAIQGWDVESQARTRT